MASIRKRGNKFQAQVRRAGFQGKSKSFERLTEAKAWARSQEIYFDRGEAGNQKPDDMPLASILSRYLLEITPTKKSASGESRRIMRLLKDEIARQTLRKLTPAKLAAFRDRRVKDGVRTAAYDLQVIRHALNIARAEWGISIPNNPVEAIRLPRPPKPRERRLKPCEYELLLFYAESSRSQFLKPLIIIAVETGMRLGELLSLTWCDVDTDAGIAVLRDTKNGESRAVPLSLSALDVLKSLPVTHTSLFGTNYHAVKSAWQRLCKRSGIHDLRFHDLRHEAISRFFEKGLTLPEVTMLSGHKTKAQALRYAHSDFTNVKKKLSE